MRPAPPSPIRSLLRARASFACAAVVVVVAATLAIFGSPADGASSSSTAVGVTVLSATNLDVSGCASGSAGTSLGSIMASTSTVGTADCSVTFGSSNDTARLSLGQVDGIGQAMFQPSRGSLDTSFDGDGRTRQSTSPNAGSDQFNGGALQADGRLVAAGACQMGATTGTDICVARYNTDGSLDTAFDGDGKLTTAVAAASGSDAALAVAIQPDGKVVVAGYCHMGATSNDFCVARYSPTGVLDTSFDGDGSATVAISAGSRSDRVNAVIVLASGKLLLAGLCNFSSGTGNDFCAARLNANGSLDTSFDGDGKLTTTIGPGANSDIAYSAVEQSDGKVVVTGACNMGTATTKYDFCAARYLTNGALDTTYSGDGLASTSIGAGAVDDYTYDSVLQPDGRLLMVGACDMGVTGKDYCAARYDTSGSLDPTFDGDGIMTTPVYAGYSSDLAYGVGLQSDGKPYLLGRCNTANLGTTFCVARLTTTGALDTTFSGDGLMTNRVSVGSDGVTGAVVQADDKVVGYGGCTLVGSTGQDGCLSRYTTAGAQDVSYDGDGEVLTSIAAGNGDDSVSAVLVQDDGKVVTGGSCDTQTATGTDACLLRYLPSGALDTTFDGDGVVFTPVGPGGNDDGVSQLVQQPDGKLVAVGTCTTTYIHFCVMRYNPDGSLDTSFATTGKTAPSVLGSGNTEYGRRMALLPDGRILVAGYCDAGGVYNFCAMRLLANGALDTSFDGDGKWTFAFGTDDDRIREVLLQPDGKVVLAGYCSLPTTGIDFCAVRILANGALDTGFGTSGRASVSFRAVAGDDTGNGAALQPDGGIVIAGSCETGLASGTDACVARLTPAGVLDTTFSGDGKATIAMAPGSSADAVRSVLLQPDGRVVLFGSCDPGGASEVDFCFARFEPNGTADVTFGTSGTYTVSGTTGASDDTGMAISSLPDGGFVAAGYADVAGATGEDQVVVALDDASLYPQYANGVNDWDQGAGAFGACLRSVSNGLQGWIANATCPATDGGWWNAVPAVAAPVATANPNTTNAVASLRFGVRTSASQAVGSYVAPIRFSVSAP